MVAAKKPASAGTGEVRRELKLALMARELAAWKLLAYAYDGSSMHLDAHNQRAFAEKCRALARRIRTEKIDILDVLEALNGLAESADDEESAASGHHG